MRMAVFRRRTKLSTCKTVVDFPKLMEQVAS